MWSPRVVALAMIAAITLGAALAVALALPAAAAVPGVVGSWHRLPPAPVTGDGLLSVWSGKEMLIFGRSHPNAPFSVNIAAAYDPAGETWRTLSPPAGPTGNYEGRFDALWTGTEMLVVGPLTREAYDPATDTWRRLPKRVGPAGIVVWTGRELIGWGGGCCGDSTAAGWRYSPSAGKVRPLADSPLAPSQRPVGAWTGRELVLWVGDSNPAGGTWPASRARAAAYDPRTDTWRPLAELPADMDRVFQRGGSWTWTGHDVLVLGGGSGGRSAYAYTPATDRWRTLAPLPSPHPGAPTVWTGKRLLVWGGAWIRDDGSFAYTGRGLAYDPKVDRWSQLPFAPLVGRDRTTAVWTGQSLIVWGGQRYASPPRDEGKVLADGAVFTPARP